MRDIFVDFVKTSELSNDIVFEEKENYASNIEKSYKILGRVSKGREEILSKFKENLLKLFKEKIGANGIVEDFESIWQVSCGISVNDIFSTQELFALNGNKINFSTDNEKITLIDFWNINCQYCRLSKIFTKNKSNNSYKWVRGI